MCDVLVVVHVAVLWFLKLPNKSLTNSEKQQRLETMLGSLRISVNAHILSRVYTSILV